MYKTQVQHSAQVVPGINLFDDTILSKSGKKIPLSAADGNPHDCPNRPQFPASR